MASPDFSPEQQLISDLDLQDRGKTVPPMPREYRQLFMQSRIDWDVVANVSHKAYIAVEFGALLGVGGVMSYMTGDLKWAAMSGLISFFPMCTRDSRHALMNRS